MDQSGGTWYQEEGRWKYRLPDQNRCEGRIIYIDGYEYCFGNDGFMQTGWFLFGKSYYYADENGHILSNTMTPDGYWLGEHGVWDQSVPRWTNPNEQKAAEQAQAAEDARKKTEEDEALQQSLTDEQKQHIWENVIAATRQRLKNPRTAKFPEWNDQFIKYRVMLPEDGREEYVIVNGWCEAKNGLGNYLEISIFATSSRYGQVNLCDISTNK